MPKYVFDGDIDFYGELYKSLDEVTNENENENENVCLITSLPLTQYHVILECGHKFNYEPLYNDILNHKKKYNNMEKRILRGQEIRCPYCRKIHKSLLPYYSELGLEKVHGVNYFDELKKLNEITLVSGGKWKVGTCCYEQVDASMNKICCLNKQVTLIDVIGKEYCYKHKYIAFKNYIIKKKIEIKQKEKEEKIKKKEENNKIKEELKNQKELAKKVAMEQKQKEKLKKQEEKLKLGKDALLCQQILKTGKNKGSICGCKAVIGNLCNRHSKANTVSGSGTGSGSNSDLVLISTGFEEAQPQS